MADQSMQDKAAEALARIRGDGAPVDSAPPAPSLGTMPADSTLGNNVQQNIQGESPNAVTSVPKVYQPLTAEQLRALADSMDEEAERAASLEGRAFAGEGKVYYTRHPNSTFIAQVKNPDGTNAIGQSKTIQFHGNKVLVSDPEIIKQMDAAADSIGSPLYTRQKNGAETQVDSLAFEQVKSRAGDIVEQMARAGIKVS